MSRGSKIDAVFYAKSYHPIQAGSIDGTDTAPHDNAVYRALLCSSAGLYDPFGDPKVIGDPYCTIFVGRLSQLTNEDTLCKAMSKYGPLKNFRLVRDIVTGASRGYAFVEYEIERDMQRAYKEAHHSVIDDCKIIVDYNRQQLMPGWIPRRLGGGLGGKKESGQLRFGGRERPFRAPLVPIPFDELKVLGIPPPPEGRYMSLFQVPSPPRRARSSAVREEHGRSSPEIDRHHRNNSTDGEQRSYGRSFTEREEHHQDRGIDEREEHTRRRNSEGREQCSNRRNSKVREERSCRRNSKVREERSRKRSYRDEEDSASKHKKRSNKEGV